MFLDNYEDGFINRFIIAYYDTSIIQVNPNDRWSFKKFIDILIHFKQLRGEWYKSDYQKEFDQLMKNLTDGNPEKTYEARMVNIYAPKLAIMLQGGLKIESSIWKRVEIILRKIIQNHYLALGSMWEDAYDAKRGSKQERLRKTITRKGPINRRKLTQEKIFTNQVELVNNLNNLIVAGYISQEGENFIENKTNMTKEYQMEIFEPVTIPELLKPAEERAEEIIAVEPEKPKEMTIFDPNEDLFK
jgi:hypothetical protein